MPATKKRPVLTTKEASEKLGVSRKTLYRNAEQIPGMEKVGAQWLLRRSQIDEAKQALQERRK